MTERKMRRGSKDEIDAEDEDEDESEDDPVDPIETVDKAPEGWYATSLVARKLGCHANRALQMVRRGELHAVRLRSNGQYLYDPDAVEEMVAAAREVGAGDLLGAAKGIIQAQMTHLERVLGMSANSAESLLKLQGDVVTDLRERNKVLEEKLVEMKTLVEKADNLDFERTLTSMEFEAGEVRNERLFAMLKTYAPAVLSIVAKKFGGPGAAAAALNPAVKEIIGSLTDDQAVRLWQSGILTKEQMTALAMLRKAVEEEPKKEEMKQLEAGESRLAG